MTTDYQAHPQRRSDIDDLSDEMDGKMLSTVGACARTVFAAVWSGYVLSVLWGWFVTPAFQAPPLTVPHAIGLALIVFYLTGSHASHELTSGQAVWRALLHPGVALVIGWVVCKFC